MSSYFDGTGFRIVASDIVFANGVNLSADGKRLYVASTLGRELLIFDRDPTSGALAKRRSLSLGTSPDSIERAADGTLWIAAHPKLLKFLANASNPESLAPSQVLAETPAADGGAAVKEVYLDAGPELPGASGAAASGKRLLIGTVFDDHFLDCTMQ